MWYWHSGAKRYVVAVARLEAEKAQNLPPLVYVEPAQIPIEGIFPARTLSS